MVNNEANVACIVCIGSCLVGFGGVHFFDLVFCFRRRRGAFDLEIQSHDLDFSSTTFFQKDENNFRGPQSRMNTSAAGGDQFRGVTKMLRSRKFSADHPRLLSR